MNRYIIVQHVKSKEVAIVTREQYYEMFPFLVVIDSFNTYTKAKKVHDEFCTDSDSIRKYVLAKAEGCPKNAPMEEKYSHLVYFYSNTKEEGKELIQKAAVQYDIKEYGISCTHKGNFKVKIAVHEEDVCDLGYFFTLQKKNIFVFDWDNLKQFAENSKQIKKRFIRDFKYLCDKLLDEGHKTEKELNDMIEDNSIFKDSLIQETYEEFSSRISDRNLKDIARGILLKRANHQ